MMTAECLDRFASIIDTDELVNRCMGNIDFASRILQLLSAQCDTEIDALERALQLNHSDDACRIAHRLKGAFANAAAHRLSQLADDVCRAARNSEYETANTAMNRLRHGWDEFTTSALDVI